MRRRSRSAVSSVRVGHRLLVARHLRRHRRRAAEQEALGAVGADRARLALGVRVAGELEHRLGLDALGDHERAALAREGHDAEHHRARPAVLDRVGHDRAVDLDEVGRQRAEHLEPGVAGADVVERELEAEPPQPRRLGEQQLLARVGALGDLEHDLVRLVAGAVRGQHEAVAREAVVLERLGGDVEEQQRARAGRPRRAAWRGGRRRRARGRGRSSRRSRTPRRARRAPRSAAARAPRSRARACRRGPRSAGRRRRPRPSRSASAPRGPSRSSRPGRCRRPRSEATTALPPRRLASSSAASARPHSVLGSRSSGVRR